MAWNMSGQLTEFCSCKLMCPCWLGPTPVPDQGWCSGAILYDIEQGQIDGIDGFRPYFGDSCKRNIMCSTCPPRRGGRALAASGC
jgi:Protein of unknown function (DUF1326)